LIPTEAFDQAFSPAKRETRKVYALVILQRKISLPVSYFVLAPLGVHPNAITAASSIVGILAAVAFALGHFVGGAWMTILWGVMDCCDGEVARLTGRQSKFGELLETLNSNLQYAIWLPAIAYGLYSGGALELGWVFAAFLACAVFNVGRGLWGKYPVAYLGQPVGRARVFLACQFKDMFELRRTDRVAAMVFYAWRNVVAQHGLFELLFLCFALFIPSGLPFLTMFYVVVYGVFGIVTFAAVNVAGTVVGR
jgi:phosphatidylglycerophosphate synthase